MELVVVIVAVIVMLPWLVLIILGHQADKKMPRYRVIESLGSYWVQVRVKYDVWVLVRGFGNVSEAEMFISNLAGPKDYDSSLVVRQFNMNGKKL